MIYALDFKYLSYDKNRFLVITPLTYTWSPVVTQYEHDDHSEKGKDDQITKLNSLYLLR